MGRPIKNTVDYFPHNTNHKKTVFILEQQYGNDGYAFWFKLLELLGSTEKHFINCNNKSSWRFLQAKTNLTEEKCLEILNLLVELEAIDKELWGEKLIWCQNFVDNIADVYKNRRIETPAKPSFYKHKPSQMGVSTDRNLQSKVKETKGNKSKVKETIQIVPAKAENAGTKQFIDWWFNKFKDTFGVKYNVQGGKEGKLAKELLAKYPYNKLVELAEKFFASDDKFIQNSGYTIGVFSSQINKLLINKIPQSKFDKNMQGVKEWFNENEPEIKNIKPAERS